MSTVTMPPRRWTGLPVLRRRADRSPQQRAASRLKWKRFGVMAVAVTAMLAALMMIFAVSAQADPAKNDYSLYKLSSATAAYFGNAQSPENASGSDAGITAEWAKLMASPGSAGSFVGFPDKDTNPLLKWFASLVSGSSATYNYDSFDAGKIQFNNSNDSGNADGTMHYAFFGAALAELGLDSTSSSLSLKFTQFIGGGTMMIVFMLAMALDKIFWGMIWLLSVLNPFKLFAEAVNNASPRISSTLGLDALPSGNPLSGVSSFISGWYGAMFSFSWAVMVPLFLGILVGTLLLFRKADAGGKIRKFLVRIVFLVVGLPILGGAYTGTLNAMLDNMQGAGASMGATKVVLSTYVDFEKWAMVNRLAVPNPDQANTGAGCKVDVSWDGYDNTPKGSARTNLRNTALCINKITGAYGDPGVIASGDAYSTSNQWNTDPSGGSATSTGAVTALLSRYISGDQVSASAFESGVKSKLTADKNTNAKNWFLEYSKDDKDLKDKKPTSGDLAEGNPVLALAPGTGLKASGWRYVDFYSQGGTDLKCNNNVTNDAGTGLSACNMSVMSMYNYLNSSFGSKEMTVYSSEKSSSGAIREMHNSVSQIGTGVMSLMYWFNSVVIMTSFVVIGLFYGLAVLFGVLRRTFQLMMSVPFAVLGAVNSIAKVIVYAVAMVVEIMGTVFIYTMVQEILMSLPQIIERPVAAWLGGMGGKEAADAVNSGATLATGGGAGGFLAGIAAGGFVSLIVLMISSIASIWFTIMALKLRKGFVSGMNEAITKVVEKFVEGSAGAPNMRGPGLGGALAGGAATGLGMAAAGRAMKGGGGLLGGSKGPGSITSGGGNAGALAAGAAGGLMGGSAALGGDGGPDGGDGGGGDSTGIFAADGTGGDGIGGAGGDAAEGQQVDENGNPIAVDESGSPIQSADGDAGSSGMVAGSDDQDRATAGGVAAQGGLSTGDGGEQKGVAAGMPGSEHMDPNTKASTAQEISDAKLDARKEQATAGAQAAVGAAETAAGAYTGNADLVQDGAQRTVEGAKGVQAGQDKVAAAEAKVGTDGPAGESAQPSAPAGHDAQQGSQKPTSGSDSGGPSAAPQAQTNAPASPAGQSSGQGAAAVAGAAAGVGAGAAASGSGKPKGPSAGSGAPNKPSAGATQAAGAAGANPKAPKAPKGAAAASTAGAAAAVGGRSVSGASAQGAPGAPRTAAGAARGSAPRPGARSSTPPPGGGRPAGGTSAQSAPGKRSASPSQKPAARSATSSPGGGRSSGGTGQSRPSAAPQQRQQQARPAPRSTPAPQARPAPQQRQQQARPAPRSAPAPQQRGGQTNVNVRVAGARTSQTRQAFNKVSGAAKSFAQSDAGKQAIAMAALNAAQTQQQRRAQRRGSKR